LEGLRLSTHKQDGHDNLRGSGRRSIIPYVQGEVCCIVVCVLQAIIEMAGMDLVAPVVWPDFYSPRPGSYTVTQGRRVAPG
jgi:hypothetical protein